MADSLTVTLNRDSVSELDMLLELMHRAAADPVGHSITMDVLFGAGFTQNGLGSARDALRAALDETESAPLPSSDASPPSPAAAPEAAPSAPAPAPAPVPAPPPAPVKIPDELVTEVVDQTALLDELAETSGSIKTLLIALVVIATIATVILALSLAV